MKIGILLRLENRSLEEAMREAAKLGADGIQLYVRHETYDLLTASSAARRAFRRRCCELNLELPALCGEVGGHGFRVAAENPVKVELMQRTLDLAHELECPVVSTHIGVIPADPTDPVHGVMLKALGTLGLYACRRGVTLALETGPESPDVLKRFINQAGGGLGVNFDPANLAMVQNSDAAEAARILGPYIVHVHAKDGVHCRDCDPVRVYEAFAEGGFDRLVAETGELFREVPLGEGQVDFPRCLAALRVSGYDGFLTIEREVGIDPERDMRLAVEFLQRQLELFPA